MKKSEIILYALALLLSCLKFDASAYSLGQVGSLYMTRTNYDKSFGTIGISDARSLIGVGNEIRRLRRFVDDALTKNYDELAYKLAGLEASPNEDVVFVRDPSIMPDQEPMNPIEQPRDASNMQPLLPIRSEYGNTRR